MSETWTEYAVRIGKTGAVTNLAYHRESAERIVAYERSRKDGIECTVVGRTVTASDWLPVDTDGAK